MKIVPVLAESYVANDNATEFTIRLRKGVKFHDGTDFNAAAVKASLERLANPTTSFPAVRSSPCWTAWMWWTTARSRSC